MNNFLSQNVGWKSYYGANLITTYINVISHIHLGDAKLHSRHATWYRALLSHSKIPMRNLGLKKMRKQNAFD